MHTAFPAASNKQDAGCSDAGGSTNLLPPSAPGAVQQDMTHLEDHEWYWGTARYVPDIINKLLGTPDGTFLVHISQNFKEGEYILIVRKDGVNEIIKIKQSNNMYGFFDTSVPPWFSSIAALIEHFKQVPLSIVNVDVTLRYPLSRSASVSVMIA